MKSGIKYFLLTLLILAACTNCAYAQVNATFLPKVTGFPLVNGVLQSDGKAIVWGEIRTVGTTPTERLIRLNVDGSLDNSFHPPVIPSDVIIETVVLDSKSKIIIGGRTRSASYCIRLNTDGSLDSTFNLDARLVRDIYQVAVLPNDSYLILNVAFGTEKYFVKLNNDGSIDESFVAPNPTNFDWNVCEMAVQADGKIIIVGSFTKFGSVTTNSIVRLKTNGDIDNTFSSGGPGNPNGNAYISSITLSGSKIIVTGSFNSFDSKTATNIVALQSNGSVDANFVYPGPAANYFTELIHKAIFVSDGILLGGYNYENGGYVYRVVKLKPDGSLDTSFLVNAFQDRPNNFFATAPSLSIASSTILFTGAFIQAGGTERRGIAQLNLNGSLKSFNPVIGGTRSEVYDAKVQADGKVIIGGDFTHVNGTVVNNLARLNSDGTLDASFAKNIGTGFDGGVHSIAIQSDGKIIVGGVFDKLNGVSKSVLVRLNADGTRDTGFNPSLSRGGTAEGGAKAIYILPTGELIVGGDLFSPSSGTQGIVKLKADGSEVMSFNLQLSGKIVNAIKAQSDGHILLGGEDFPNGFLRRIKSDGTVVNNFSTVNLSSYLISDIDVLPDDKFVVSGFLPNGPHPLLQFTSSGNLLDDNSVAVNDGVLMGVKVLEDGSALLSGFFKTVNGAPREGLAKIKLNGSLSPSFDLPVDGFVRKLVKVNGPYREFYAIGSFTSIDSIKAFNITKVIDPIPVTIQVSESSLSQTYDKKAKVLSITTVPAGVSYSVTFTNGGIENVQPIDAGTYQATVKVNDIHYTGSETVTLVVNKALAIVQAKSGSLAQTYSGDIKVVETTTTPTGLNVLVQYSQNGSVKDAVSAGVYDVVMNIDDPNYSGTGSATLTINKAAQNLTFVQPEDKTLGDTPFPLQATASSGLAVQFEAVSSNVVISGSQVTLVRAGRGLIKASQSGDSNYLQSNSIERSFCIRPAKPSITSAYNSLDELVLTSNGSEGNQWYFNDIKLASGTNSQLIVSEPGAYKVTVKTDDCVSEFSDQFSVVITGDLNADKGIELFPNPIEDYFMVVGVKSGAIGKMYDLKGTDMQVSYSTEDEKMKFDVRSTLPGFYIVRILELDRQITLKVVKK